MSLPGISLTDEQKAIIATCLPPSPTTHGRKQGRLIRATAAAGSGKTTTLLALALRGAELGHTSITYVTFTKSAAKDGKERLERVMQASAATRNVSVEARTLHSFAMGVPVDADLEMLSEDEEEEAAVSGEPSQYPTVWTEGRMKVWAEKECAAAVEEYLQRCFHTLSSRDIGARTLESHKQRARDKVNFFIIKSLKTFCQHEWSLQQYRTKKDEHGKNLFGRDYYPIALFFKDKKSEEWGFPKGYYDTRTDFFALQAANLFKKATRQGITTHDFTMKRAQLRRQEIPGTLLLVDESQDMDGCQIDWIAKTQVELGKFVYCVGDPVQTIFGFRGAKSTNLMGLECHQDLKLTESWRFGTNISHIANLTLFAKEFSPQTKQNKYGRPTSWIPYRTSPGFPDKESIVTTSSLISQWKTMKVTIIARTNVSLMLEAMNVLGFGDLTTADGEDNEHEQEDAEMDGKEGPALVKSDDSDSPPLEAVSDPNGAGADPDSWPKIHLNGRGENSGLKLWEKGIAMISQLSQLWMLHKEDERAVMKLDSKQFDDFQDMDVNWTIFTEKVEEEELTKYATSMSVVKRFKEKTMQAIEAFKTHVMDLNVSAEDADLILTTCHSAKGMEWENVHVCGDFLDLCTFKQVIGTNEGASPLSRRLKRHRSDPTYQFGFSDWGDAVNLTYVACTRAKTRLYLPKTYTDVLKSFDTVWAFVNGDTKGPRVRSISLKGMEKVLDEEGAKALHRCLVAPLRKEWGLEGHQLLATAFIEHEDDDKKQKGSGAMVENAEAVNNGAVKIEPDTP